MKVFGQDGGSTLPRSPRERAPRQGSWPAAVARWSSLILQMAVRELDARFGSTRYGALLALAEPFLLVLLLVTVRSIFRGGVPFGTSAVIFYSSGIFPYYVFMRLSSRSQRAGSGRAGRLPSVTRTVSLLGTSLAESALILSAMLVWFAALYVYGLQAAVPYHLGSCLAAISGLWLIGFGIGLCNAAVIRYFPGWAFVWGRIRRPMMILSGVFFVADYLPYWMRSIAVWNPLLHGIEWFRWGLYGNYPIMLLDIDYFLGFAAGTVFIGIIMFWSTIRSGR